MSGPLSHIRVVEMTIAIQGPGAGLFLRDMGAEVIKVEPPIGDGSRYHRGANNTLPPEALGSQFVAMNRGKRSVCLDVHTPLGGQAVQRLIERADVFLSNYRAPALAKMGLDYASVHALNPRLVYATVNGFGPLGPDAGKSMLDGAAIARGGIASVTGTNDHGPMAPGATIADTAGALQFALGIVTALVARGEHGAGQHVQTSALGAQLWLQQWELTHVWMTGQLLRRSGPHHPNIPGPYGIYQTADGGHFLFAVAQTNEAWDAFWAFAEDPIEAINPAWDAPGKRLGNGATIAEALAVQEKMRAAFKRHTTARWEAFFAEQPDIIHERIRDYHDVRDDPQCRANGYVEELDLPLLGPTATVGNLMSFSATPAATGGPPPALGADTAGVLGELGFTEEQIGAAVEHATRAREAAFAAAFGRTAE